MTYESFRSRVGYPAAPRWKGHEFLGWYDAPTGGTKILNADGTVVTSGMVTDGTDLRLYAQYDVARFTVNFFDETGVLIAGPLSVDYGTNFGAITGAPSIASIQKPGYKFKGWWERPNGDGNRYINADGTTGWIVTGNTNVYAAYEASTASVFFMNQDGTRELGKMRNVVYGIPYNNFKTMAGYPSNLVIEEYIFQGWYSAPNGGGVQILDENGNDLGANATDGVTDVRLYAYYTLDPNVDLIFDGSGGVMANGLTREVVSPRPVRGTMLTAADLMLRSPVNKGGGYIFYGWRISQTDGTAILVRKDDISTFAGVVLDSNTTITADYIAPTVSYTVRHVSRATGAQVAPDQVFHGELGSTVTGYAVAIPGYRPVESSKTLMLGTGSNVITISYIGDGEYEDSDLEFVVEFVDYDGTLLKRQEVEAGEDATPPADPEREGYEFTGWDTDYTNVRSNLVVTAQYVVSEEIGGGDTPGGGPDGGDDKGGNEWALMNLILSLVALALGIMMLIRKEKDRYSWLGIVASVGSILVFVFTDLMRMLNGADMVWFNWITIVMAVLAIIEVVMMIMRGNVEQEEEAGTEV